MLICALLSYVAMCCAVLWYIAMCCDVLNYNVMCSIMLCCVGLYYGLFQCVGLCWTTVEPRIKEPVFVRTFRLKFHRLNPLDKNPTEVEMEMVLVQWILFC